MKAKIGMLLLALLGASQLVRAQQLLNERVLQWPVQRGFAVTGLLSVQPDSLRLLSDYQATKTNALSPTTTALRRVNVGNCDTLPGVAYQATAYLGASKALVTRRGQVLITNSAVVSNQPLTVQFLGRNGQLRWTSTLSTDPGYKDVTGLLEAPDRGFFVAGRIQQKSYLTRLDSLGNMLWQRSVSKSVIAPLMSSVAYARNGNLVFYSWFNVANVPTTGLFVVNQNGDSLTQRVTAPIATQTSIYQYPSGNSLLPLKDAGFIVVGQIDSANTGYYRPYITRLDQNLNVVWSTIYRSQPVLRYQFLHPYELADGSLVMLATNKDSGAGAPYWLFRYSAAGVLLQRYAFTSTLLPSLQQGAFPANVGPLLSNAPEGMQPLSDSTFVLATGLRWARASQSVPSAYLAHFKVPGLRRVVDLHYIPATNSPLAVRATSLAFPAPAYPNPAREIVTVPLPASRAAGQLVLTDLAGRRVLAQPVAAGAASATLPVRGVAAGLYLLRLEVPGQPPGTQRLAIEQ